MSRIGKRPVSIPGGVTADIADGTLTVKGPKGTLSRTFHPDMQISRDGDVMHVTRPDDSAQHRSLHGLSRSLVYQAIVE